MKRLGVAFIFTLILVMGVSATNTFAERKDMKLKLSLSGLITWLEFEMEKGDTYDVLLINDLKEEVCVSITLSSTNRTYKLKVPAGKVEPVWISTPGNYEDYDFVIQRCDR
ncbi:MAG: hypothetical protein GY797_38305 [Deltaproteobacteria bacterium]|nr:hypothetical protein [Deltaproteobacteria bacterium]